MNKKNAEFPLTNIQPHNLTELEKYYKKVITCKLCKSKYGIDTKTDSRICPACEVRLTGLTRVKNRRINGEA